VPPPADDAAAVGRALQVAMAYDPEAYRAFMDIEALPTWRTGRSADARRGVISHG
jgi:hypothetical protein